jgi:ribose-phosphate pyrophosphokinase
VSVYEPFVRQSDTVIRSGLNFGTSRLRIFGGSSTGELPDRVARYLGKEGTDRIIRKRFSDGELYVKLPESVRGCDVFLICSTCGPCISDSIMELLITIDAVKRAHAAQVTVVVPYYGYARADRLVEKREALSSKLMANLITRAGADRMILVDIHSPQSCGYFDIPVDHLYASPALVRYLMERIEQSSADTNHHGAARQLADLVVVAPDVGGVARARAFAKALCDAPLAIIDKRRSGHNVAEVMNLIGEVDGKIAVLVDDMIDTAGTICAAARLLREKGAACVFAMATHAVFSGPAIERLSEPGLFEEVIVTDTIPVPREKQFPQLRVVTIDALLGEQIWSIHRDSSISRSVVL